MLRRNGLDPVIGHVGTIVRTRGGGRDGIDDVDRLVVFVVLLVRVVTVGEPAIVLHEAKVDRHLAHRAGHPSVLRRTTHASPRTQQTPETPYATDITGPGAICCRATPYQFSGVSRRFERRPRGLRSSRPR